MNILVIDTASDNEIVMVSTPDRLCAMIEKAYKSHAVTLFDNIQKCLKDLDLTIRDIRLIAAGTGPGSFTGIRIAVTTARMLAQVLGVPLVGISTHEFFAYALPAERSSHLLVAFDAKKGKVFGALYKTDPETMQPRELISPGDYEISRLLNSINASEMTISAGDGIDKYHDQVSAKLTLHKHVERITPENDRIRRFLIDRYEKDPDYYLNYENTVPQYTRKSDAEIMKDTQGSGR